MFKAMMVVAAAGLAGLAWAVPASAEGGKPAWSYEGGTGPAAWPTLSAEFATCGTGREQSPIDLAAARPGPAPTVVVDYRPLPLTILHNGHTVEVVVENGSRITVDGKEYELLQFHFHTPSEHVVGGKAFDGEVHFVHRAGDGSLAVIGVLLDAGARNSVFVEVLARTPRSRTAAWTFGWVTIDPAKILPPMTAFWSYGSSLTTPPCSEGVRWMVQKLPAPLSREHVAMLGRAMGENARPVQAVNGRQVVASQ